MSQRDTLRTPALNRDFFAYLPLEMIIDILSRLPVRTIIACKCVCKSWLNLLGTREFAESHLSKSVPGLAVHQFKSRSYKLLEREDVVDHELKYNPVTNFDLPFRGWLQSSYNGLLLMSATKLRTNVLYLCNPITRDYVKIDCPQEFACSCCHILDYGFGASKVTGQHKVVEIFHSCTYDLQRDELPRILKSECQIYTLETGSWRRIAPGAPFGHVGHTIGGLGAFLNGNLHWLVFDLNDCPRISCFDLETELFSTFSPPPLHTLGIYTDLFALGDCLCLCHKTSVDEMVFWLMKEYGTEKSWTKEFVIRITPCFAELDVYPIGVLEDGDILAAWEGSFLFYYSKKNKCVQKIGMFELGDSKVVLHTPSFLSLKSFGAKSVSSF